MISGSTPAKPSEATPTGGDTSVKVKRQSALTDQGWFDLCDLTEGQSVFRLLSVPTTADHSTEHPPTFQMRVEHFDDDMAVVPVQSMDGTDQITDEGGGSGRSGFSTTLSHGVQFQTGRLVWRLTALPQDQVLTIKMFHAAREGRLEDLRGIVESSRGRRAPHVMVSSPASTAGQPRRLSQFKFSTLSIVTEEGMLL